MNSPEIKKELFHAQTVLNNTRYDFQAKYLAVCEIRKRAQTERGQISLKSIIALEETFQNQGILNETQAYFFYREAAGAICEALTASYHDPGHQAAFEALMRLLKATSGRAHRAVSEALGSLPFSIRGPFLENSEVSKCPAITWGDLLNENRLPMTVSGHFVGRSLVSRDRKTHRLLVVKFATQNETPKTLLQEVRWLRHMGQNGCAFGVRFHIPKALGVQKNFFFRLKDAPVKFPPGLGIHSRRFAIAFLAHPDYFNYPNGGESKNQLTAETFFETMCRNAFLFGKLTGQGVIHGAPVPLFHNRVQAARRNDRGRYLWQRAGRLDQWLNSCRYPNFGCSGIRDFEHLASFRGPARRVYGPIGAHLLSLFLVAGSYFRMKNQKMVGLDKQGRPVDARALFDKALLAQVMEGIFHQYYLGFSEHSFKGELPLDTGHLVDRMVDEMGVDRYMEEILRVADQREMTDDAFVRFLKDRNVPEEAISQMKRGLKDITLFTGPHLGGFNQRISIPELIEAVGTMAALCVYGRYRTERLRRKR